MARDIHPGAKALIEKHGQRLRCSAYMGEGWEREYVTQDAVSDALRQRDDLLEALNAADEALALITAFEDDARYIMGNTNFAIVKTRRALVKAAISRALGEA